MPGEMLINATVCSIHCTVSPNRLHHINWRILLTWLSTQKHGRLSGDLGQQAKRDDSSTGISIQQIQRPQLQRRRRRTTFNPHSVLTLRQRESFIGECLERDLHQSSGAVSKSSWSSLAPFFFGCCLMSSDVG